MIYTGGTIGMMKDYTSGALKAFDFSQLQKNIPELNQLDCTISSFSFDHPIDSSNMNPTHWIAISDIITEKYNEFDGFVVLHGSDTMSYSASALSFLLENLSKPVILTGSQLPIKLPSFNRIWSSFDGFWRIFIASKKEINVKIS